MGPARRARRAVDGRPRTRKKDAVPGGGTASLLKGELVCVSYIQLTYVNAAGAHKIGPDLQVEPIAPWQRGRA
jgi:hypothetical protein